MIVLVHANFHTKMVILFCDYCGSNISKCGADTYLSATSGVAGLLEEMFFLALGPISSFKSNIVYSFIYSSYIYSSLNDLRFGIRIFTFDGVLTNILTIL